MLNVLSVLQHKGLSIDSPIRAMQTVRDTILAASNQTAAANNIIIEILGDRTPYTDPVQARLMAMCVTEAAARNQGVIKDVEEFVLQQEARTAKQMKQTWMYTSGGPSGVVPAAPMQPVKGTDVKVAVTAGGNIKKGGKTVIAEDIFKKFMKSTKLDPKKPEYNRAFQAMLMAPLADGGADMTKAGATTYTYNMRKKFGVKS